MPILNEGSPGDEARVGLVAEAPGVKDHDEFQGQGTGVYGEDFIRLFLILHKDQTAPGVL